MFATGLATDIIAELDEVGGGYVPRGLLSTASAWHCLESRTYVCWRIREEAKHTCDPHKIREYSKLLQDAPGV